MMNATTSIFLHSSSYLSKPSGVVSCCFPRNYTNKNNLDINVVAARDMVIEFGKHKGKMLGTVSSEYLRWMSKNLNTGDFEKWGRLAEDVLQDEVYADRMEWEVAERLLSGETGGSGNGVAKELEETSKRFGWDYNDKLGWSKVDFKLLGTSKGGRLPRRTSSSNVHQQNKAFFDKKQRKCNNVVVGVGREKRRERSREQQQKKKKMLIREEYNHNKKDKDEEEEMNNNNNERGKQELLFPGRQSVIRKLVSE